MNRIAITAGLFLALTSPAWAEEIRIDTFDKHSRRTGYFIIDSRTGRVDQYDTRSNRLGYGTVTAPPCGRIGDPRPLDGPSSSGTSSSTPDRGSRR